MMGMASPRTMLSFSVPKDLNLDLIPKKTAPKWSEE